MLFESFPCIQYTHPNSTCFSHAVRVFPCIQYLLYQLPVSVCCLCASSQRQLEKDLAVIAAESEKEGERGAMVSSLRLNLWFIAALGP